jgi:hypothetical protein
MRANHRGREIRLRAGKDRWPYHPIFTQNWIGAWGLASNYLQSGLGTVLQGAGLTSNATAGSTTAVDSQTDNQQLSPFARLMSTMQQLQQSNPSEYQQVTQQIAGNPQSGAQTAQADGDSTAASQFSQLSSDFSNASQSGQLPNMQDLAQAMSGDIVTIMRTLRLVTQRAVPALRSAAAARQ